MKHRKQKDRVQYSKIDVVWNNETACFFEFYASRERFSPGVLKLKTYNLWLRNKEAEVQSSVPTLGALTAV